MHKTDVTCEMHRKYCTSVRGFSIIISTIIQHCCPHAAILTPTSSHIIVGSAILTFYGLEEMCNILAPGNHI